MNTLYPQLPSGLTEALGSALFHSLWQAAAAGLALLLCILIIPRRYAQARYLAGVLSIIAMVAMPAATFFLSYPETTAMATGQPVTMTISPEIPNPAAGTHHTQESSSLQDTVMQWFQARQPLLVTLWIIGMAFFALRFSGGYLLSRRLRRRGLGQAPEHLLRLMERMALRMRVGQPVTLHTSTRVSVPLVVGFLKPVILFPAGMLADLSPDQVELILAHELAHVRRYDYAVNMLLSMAQILLFFHPAMWLALRVVRQERENACDAVALQYHPDPARYARTLLTLETYRQRGLAMAATGGSLTERITRILNMRGKPNPFHFAAAGILALALVASVMASTYRHNPIMQRILGTYEEEVGNVTLDDVVITASDTGPVTDTYTYVQADSEEVVITIMRDGNKTEIRMRDGEVVSATENGQPVPADRLEDYREVAAKALANTTTPVPPAPGAPHLEPVPPVPPAPVWRDGDDEASFNRRMERWEDDMEEWEEEMEEWSERNEEALAAIPPTCEGDMRELGRSLEELSRGLEESLGDERQLEELGRHMEQLARTLEDAFVDENGDPRFWDDEQTEKFERDMEKFGKDMERWGEDLGKRMEEMGERLARQAEERAHRNAEEAERNAEEREDDADAAGHGYRYTTDGIAQLADALRQDGLITDKDDFTFKINEKGMWVNGKRVDDKYRDDYEDMADELFSTGKVSVEKKGGSSSLTLD